MEQKQEEIAIAVDHISKVYKLYDKPMDRMVEALGLTKKKKYREHFALSDVSFQVKKENAWELSVRMAPVNPQFLRL